MHNTKNEFLLSIYDFYDSVRFPEEKENTSNSVSTYGKKSIWICRKKTNDKDIALVSAYDKIIAFSNRLKKEIPTFERLWDFCEFIRTAEKIFFFKNDIDNKIYVEYNMSDDSEMSVRKLRIKDSDDYEIRFTLEKKILFETINTIKINIVREYGLQMKNTYLIVNGDIKYEDDSDLYLINEINHKLMDTISSTFLSVSTLILNSNKKEDIS